MHMGDIYDCGKLEAAGVCFVAASRLLYCEPDDAEIANQVEQRMFEEAPFGMDDARVRAGLTAMDAWCDEPLTAERMAALKREWFRLFVGAGTPDAPSWESFYVDPNSQLFSKHTLEVRAWYQRYGLQIERLHAEPDDHLGLMLGFVGHLAGLEAEALSDGDEARARQLAHDQEAFLVEHVLPWLAAWRYSVNEHAASGYFRGAADLVFGLCACYARRFDVVFDEDKQVFKRTSG